jgi:pimeloyl-ACP methyl ester carboxylesterase
VVLAVAVASSAGIGGNASSAGAPSTGAPTEEPTEIRAEAVTERGVPYATWKGRTLTLDIHAPAEPEDAPVVVYLPGLGEYGVPFALLDGLIENGAIVFVVRYAAMNSGAETILAAGSVDVRAMADSVACAMHMARDRAAQLGSADPVAVLTGFSMGGAPAAHAALFGSDLERRWEEFAAEGGPPRQAECEVATGSTHVDALVGLAGAYDMFVPAYEGKYGRGYQQARNSEQGQFLASAVGLNPGLRIRLIHGTRDSTIPYENSPEFAEVLSEAGYDVQVVDFEGGHGVDSELTLSTILGLIGR